MASHVTLVVGTHYCGGEAVEAKIVLGNTELGCGMEDMESACGFSDNSITGVNLQASPCCQNEYHSRYITDDYVKDAARYFFNIDFAFVDFFATLNTDIVPKPTYPFYTSYIPPPLKKDFRVLFQTFII